MPVFLSGESHGQRTLGGCSPRGHRAGHNWVANTSISPLKEWRKFCTVLKFALDYNFISIFSTLKSLTFWRNIVNILVLILYLTCSFLRIWISFTMIPEQSQRLKIHTRLLCWISEVRWNKIWFYLQLNTNRLSWVNLFIWFFQNPLRHRQGKPDVLQSMGSQSPAGLTEQQRLCITTHRH